MFMRATSLCSPNLIGSVIMDDLRGEIGRVSFTLGDALRLGYGYIKRRKDRAAINVASIALAVSFLASLMLTDLFYRAYERGGGASLGVDAYLYLLVFVALAVSIVGITNAMLIAVYERYREIGTMKCLGASDSHILMLFLVESFIEGTAGGIAGFLVGYLAAILSVVFTTGVNIVFKVNAGNMLFLFSGSTLISIILSVGATLYPAWRGAKLTPVEALSHEL